VKFQELCADLLAQDARYVDSQVYGRNGQAQRGIDVLAVMAAGVAVDVGQCKCWEGKTTQEKIHEATEEFLPHFEHWKSQGIRRFILFSACSANDTKIQDQILLETRRFKDHSVEYEFWDARKLHRELRPHPHVVRTHIGQSWVSEICGATAIGSDPIISAGTMAVVRRQGLLVTELASLLSKELEAVRELAAEGKGAEALRQIAALQQGTSWEELPEETRAKALRIQSSLALNVLDDLNTAEQLLNQAKATCPSANTRPLEAILLRDRISAQAAFDFLTPPRTVEEWNLRLQFLLELGRPEEVLIEVETPPPGIKPTTETAHAQSLALLINRQVDSAREVIQGALAAKPHHFNLRHAAAVVDYASTIASSFPAWRHLLWPLPPKWLLVKRDPGSVVARRSAAKTFRELAELAPDRDRESLLMWELACIANEVDQQEAAQLRVQAILRGSPSCVPAIIWASERGYEFDRTASIGSLRNRVTLATATQEEVETLIALLANSGDPVAAETVLQDTETKFTEWKALQSWRIYKVQFLSMRGEMEEAKKLIADETDLLQRENLERLRLRVSIPATKDVRPLAEHLEQVLKATRNDDLLLDCCEAKASVGDWGFVADHAERLILASPTEGSLRLAVEATFKCNRYGTARALIEKHAGMCAGGKLAADLRQLRAECLRHEGDLPKAIAELENLAAEKPDFASLAHLFRLQHAKGDLQAGALTARRILEAPNVPAEFLLQIAPIVRIRDQDLAGKLWEKAVKGIGDAPSLKVQAAFQAFTLGLESRATELLKALPALAESGKGPVRAVSLPDAIELFKSSSQNAQELAELHSKGLIPIHILPRHLGLTLTHLILAGSVESSSVDVPHLQPPLLIRYGGRAQQSCVRLGSDQRTIFLDLTSALLFQGLKLLDLVERSFETIVISENLTSALTSDLAKLMHHQPALLSAKRAVLALVDAGRLRPHEPPAASAVVRDTAGELMGGGWFALLRWIRERNGLLVEHFPLMSNELSQRPVELAPDDARLVCSPMELMRAMAAAGLVPGGESAGATEANRSSASPSGLVLQAGMPVRLQAGIAAELASENVLSRLAAHCVVFIDAAEVLEMRRESDRSTSNEGLHAEIARLLQRVSSGQSEGKYRTHLHPSPKIPNEHEAVVTPEELCLYDAVHFGEDVGAPVCCDDRFLQAYHHTGRSVIVGVSDLLHSFLERGVFNKETFFDWLFRLRLANARFLPPSTEEILHYLRIAPIRDGEVEETPAMRILRRSVAAMLLDRNRLQESVVSGTGDRLLREMEFPVVCNRAASDALAEVWSSEQAHEEATARADWLWSSLLVDLRALRQCFKSQQAPESDLHWLGVTIGMWYAQGFRITGSRGDRAERRGRYFDWLTSRAVAPLARNTPLLWKSIARSLCDSLAFANEHIDQARKEHGEMSPEAMGPRILIGELIMDLPEKVVAEMELSKEAMERWGLQAQEPCVVVAGLQFAQREFWAAVSRVVINGRATLITPDGKNKMRLARGPRANTVRVGKNGVLDIEFLNLFHREVEPRRRLLRSNSWWFDLDLAERENAIEEIVTEQVPSARVASLEAYRDDSMPMFYSRLQTTVRRKQELEIDDLMPDSADALLRFLRLGGSGSPDECGSDTDPVARLVDNEGLEASISRMACIPAALPSVVLSEWQRLDGVCRDAMLERLTHKAASFVQRLHVGRLWVASLAESDRRLERIRELVRYLCDAEHGGAECKEFLGILEWVHLRLAWLKEAQAWSPGQKLRIVWTHAAQLQAVFSSERRASTLGEWFSAHCQELTPNPVGGSTSFERDICYPRNVDYGAFILRGIAFLFEGVPDETLIRCGVRESISQALDKQGKEIAGSSAIWRPVYQEANLLGSFLAKPRDAIFSRLVDPDALRKYFDLEADKHLLAALRQLEVNSSDGGLWMVIDFLRGTCCLSSAEQDHLSRALGKVELSLEHESNARLPELIMVACQYAAILGNAAITSNLREQLFKLAVDASALQRRADVAPREQADWRRIGAALLDAVWKLNVVPHDAVRTARGFVHDAVHIIRAWPALASECRSVLTGIVSQLPVDCQTTWIPLQVELRALG
jgi:tetratricopeptide (TPR) repeat protein